VTVAARADSSIASSGFQSVPTAEVRQVADSAPQALADSADSAADRAEEAAPAAVGDCRMETVHSASCAQAKVRQAPV
jgi:hypothetical protein